MFGFGKKPGFCKNKIEGCGECEIEKSLVTNGTIDLIKFSQIQLEVSEHCCLDHAGMTQQI